MVKATDLQKITWRRYAFSRGLLVSFCNNFFNCGSVLIFFFSLLHSLIHYLAKLEYAELLVLYCVVTVADTSVESITYTKLTLI